MDKFGICLWYDGTAEEAAQLYTSLFPDSRITRVDRSPADNPSTKEGAVLTVEFELGGRAFMALNGGPHFQFNEAMSIMVECADQAEVDRYWDALIADGGEPSMCGWLKDRFGVSWQIIPKQLNELLRSPDPDAARRTMEAMLSMRRLDVAQLQAAHDGTAALGGTR
jgi:predicted 3-demethylubiquinone-9 3-methyltransferase (glyoxalase superfamily)